MCNQTPKVGKLSLHGKITSSTEILCLETKYLVFYSDCKLAIKHSKYPILKQYGSSEEKPWLLASLCTVYSEIKTDIMSILGSQHTTWNIKSAVNVTPNIDSADKPEEIVHKFIILWKNTKDQIFIIQRNNGFNINSEEKLII